MARQRVTVEQLRQALVICQGNVSKMAVLLGIARNNVYKRLAALEMNPQAFRGNSAQRAPGTDAVTDYSQGRRVASTEKVNKGVNAASVSRNAILNEPAGARTLAANMRTAAGTATVEEEGGARQLRQSRTLYLRPDQYRALDEACLDLPAVLREKLSPSKVMERFMDEAFAAWIAGLKGPAKNGKKR